jgi:hypothetical protein
MESIRLAVETVSEHLARDPDAGIGPDTTAVGDALARPISVTTEVRAQS